MEIIFGTFFLAKANGVSQLLFREVSWVEVGSRRNKAGELLCQRYQIESTV